MQLRDYISVIVKRWWVIALTAMTAVVAAYGVSKLLPHTFRSQAVYLALANQADNGLNIVLRNSMNSYREMVLQPSVLDQISQNLGLDIRGEKWMADVNIQPRPDEQKIVIEVDAASLDQSQAMANAVGDRM
ncbi:MAG: lipopolysaccharide biosynthesis protein, partial [Oscillochloris sp.]|nr:lipopolysaccharide biosynthesis protein [Oscillochloris sp.]